MAWLSLGAIPLGTRAEDEIDPGTESMVLDTVRVAEPRARDLDPLDRPGLATVVEVTERGRLRSVADLLEEIPGVRVRRYGGLGSLATASIRGSSPTQVSVYVDGVPLDSSQFGLTNLSELPLDHLARIEVYRSGAPARFPAAGIGGVVNLVTRDADALSKPTPGMGSITDVEGRVAAGSHGTFRSSALLSGEIGAFRHLVSYHQLRSEGEFAFRYDPTTPHNPDDDAVDTTYANNDFAEHGLLVKLGGPTGAGSRLDVQGDWFWKEAGNPGHHGYLYEEARVESRRGGLRARLASPRVLGERVEVILSGFVHRGRNTYTNPLDEPGLGRLDARHHAEALGVQARVISAWPRLRQRIEVDATWREERFTPESRRDDTVSWTEEFERERRATDIVAEDTVTLWRDRLLLVGSYRYQETRDNFHGPLPFGRPPMPRADDHRASWHGPSVGTRVIVHPRIVVKANRSSYVRFPTLYELFGTNGDVKPNPELAPERGTTWDGSVTWQRNAPIDLTLEVGFFYTERDSLIEFIEAARAWKPVNVARAVGRGAEVALSAGWGPVRVEGSFTTQDVRQESPSPNHDGKWMPYVSPRELSLSTSLRVGRSRMRYELLAFDGYHVDRPNQPHLRVPAREIHAVGARVALHGERLALDLEVQNLADARVSDVFGYPLPGRTVVVLLEGRLGS
jgi:iron complex outermembrane receptor protein